MESSSISKQVDSLYNLIIDNYKDYKESSVKNNEIFEKVKLFLSELSSEKKPVSESESSFLKIGELLFFYLAFDQNYQKYVFQDKVLPIIRKLKIQDSSYSNLLSSSIYTSLIAGLDVLEKEVIQDIINELNDITDADWGNTTARNNSITSHQEPNPKYFKFLSISVYKEVISFLKFRKSNTLSDQQTSKCSRIKSPVISVSSRKGGSGKTTFLLNTLNWFYDKYPEKEACIVDLDLSGPVWQYLLTNKEQLNRLKSGRKFIDIFFTIKWANNPDGLEINQDPNRFDVLSTINYFDWPFNGLKKKVGLCTFRDIPYTNRQINSALEYKRTNFYDFLISYITHLSENFDLILIDSGPGFSSIPFCSLSIAGIVNQGIPLVISSPALCDIYGTLMEFGDLRFVNLNRAPSWWINKENGQEYFKNDLTWLNLAEDLGITDFGDLKLIKLLQKEILKKKKEQYKWNTLPFDETINQIGSITKTGTAQKPEINADNSTFYLALKEHFDKSELCNYFDNQLKKKL